MKIRHLWLGFGLLFAALGARAEDDLATRCASPEDRIWELSCSEAPLRTAMAALQRALHRARAAATEDMRETLDAAQQAWHESLYRTCELYDTSAPACLSRALQERREALAALARFDARPRGSALQLIHITPRGEAVPPGQQIVLQFDRPMVPLGEMAREAASIPVSIAPALDCQWRWLNTSALACQLREEAAMQPATRYRLVLQGGLRGLDGAALAGEVRHEFATEGPRVQRSDFATWLSPGEPLIEVYFSQPVSRASLEQHLRFVPAGDGAGVGVVAFATRDEQRAFLEKGERVAVGESAERYWLVQPREALPLDSPATLMARSGLRTPLGPLPSREEQIVASFHTFPEFRWLGLQCTPFGERESRFIPRAALEQEDAPRCVPDAWLGLVFSAPVLPSALREGLRLVPDLSAARGNTDPWADTQDWSRLSSSYSPGQEYIVWLPEQLLPHREYQLSFDAAALRDEFGRGLAEGVELRFHSAHREPDLSLNHSHAVLEAGLDSELPLYTTNLSSVDIRYQDDTASATSAQRLTLPPAEDQTLIFPLGVRGLLQGRSGAVQGELSAQPQPKYQDEPLAFFAQVTPFQVHVKLGHYSSLAWVSRFDNGKAVKGAKLSLWRGRYHQIGQWQPMHYSAGTDRQGLATLPGLSTLDPNREWLFGGDRRDGLFLKVELGEERAWLPLTSDYQVTGEAWPYSQPEGGHTQAWGFTAQGVYKLGDTLDFKIYVRDQSNRHWVAPSVYGDYELRLYDAQGQVIYEKVPLSLNAFGSFADSLRLPTNGAVGWYRFELTPTRDNSQGWRFRWEPMSVLVSDFTPSPFSVAVHLNGERFTSGASVTAEAQASLYAGGPFASAPLRLSAQIQSRPFRSALPAAEGFYFGAFADTNAGQESLLLGEQRDTLDRDGRFRSTLTLPEGDLYVGDLQVEASVQDERGKFVAARASARVFGRDRFVGLRSPQWLFEQGKSLPLEVLVVSSEDKAVAGVPVQVAIERMDYRVARVKGAGNAYLAENIAEWVGEGVCTLVSTGSASRCDIRPERAGLYRLVATIEDSRGRPHRTELQAWSVGQGEVVWDQGNDATLPLIAEKASWAVGDKARFLVKNPFPGARALVSVERYGVLESWVQELKGGTPVIEVPIKEDYLPGFYLSVVAFSPRVEAPPPVGAVDLGKPSYRIGYSEVKVVDRAKALDISIETDRATYKPRDTVKVDLRVASRALRKTPVELAVVVIDESVLALNGAGSGYYDPQAGFNRLDSLDVLNFSLVSRLIGRQKFEKKGANPGGDGAITAQLRDQFTFVAHWEPSLLTDKKGRAQLSFTLPDNLTRWRVLAVAVNTSDRMGVSEASFTVSRPTELRPALPNQLRVGDRAEGRFSVMNRSDRARTLTLRVQVGEGTEQRSTLALQAYARGEVSVPLVAEAEGALVVTVSAGDASDSDATRVSVPVLPRYVLQSVAQYDSTSEASLVHPVAVPEGAAADVGSLATQVSRSLIPQLEGAIRYVRDYPHLCWEQRLARALGAHHAGVLKPYLADDPWPAAAATIEEVLARAPEFQAPNGGMSVWQASNVQVDPYLSAYTALVFSWLAADGHAAPAQVTQRLHDYLEDLLRRDSFPGHYQGGMQATVRAVALAALARAGVLDQDAARRHLRHVPTMDSFGLALYLDALTRVAGIAESERETVRDALLARSDRSAGSLSLNRFTEGDDAYLMGSAARAQCALLSALSADPQGADWAPLVAREALAARRDKAHWRNTQENAFCLQALSEYAARFETTRGDSAGLSIRENGVTLTEGALQGQESLRAERPLRAADRGQRLDRQVTQGGSERLYVTTELRYAQAEARAEAVDAGFELRREYSLERNGTLQLLSPGETLVRGDLVWVDLYLRVPAPRHFVVLNDPLPGAFEPVNSQLATAAISDDSGRALFAPTAWYRRFDDWRPFGGYFSGFHHSELRHDHAAFYADYLPKGGYHLRYRVQVVSEGDFFAPPAKAEAMYQPDIHGLGLPATVTVRAEP